MSSRNREKRAAKQKFRRRATAGRGSDSGFPSVDRVGMQDLLRAVVRAAVTCHCGDVDGHVDDLVDGFGAVGGELEVAVETATLELVRDRWERGWTPTDVLEMSRRHLGGAEAEYLQNAMLVEARRYAAATFHPHWQVGLISVAASLGVDPDDGPPDLRRWAWRTGRTRAEALGAVLRALRELASLPPLEQIVPLPGEGRHVAGAVAAVDEKMLAKVRALLAKAESTQFSEEAEALSAKAQELMSRYALHQALRDHDSGRRAVASARRLWLDAPYAGAKVHLVQAVATSNRCRTVWCEQLGLVTIVGEGSDLDVVNLLTTSLLVQANRAMLASGPQVTRSGTSRTRSFRRSFLVAYATRIGERLSAVDTATTQEAAADARLLPVLAARSQAADDLTERLFPHLVSRSTAVSNAAGWGAGRAAADLALFDAHAAVAG